MPALKRPKRPTSRRMQIKLAALHCFLAKGYVATTIADIRARSGATTGSIYHFFENKGALALELFSDAIADWADETARAVTGDSPEARLRASVIGLLRWGLTAPDWFRFMDEVRALASNHPDLAPCAEMLARAEAEAAAFYDGLASIGRVRALPRPIAHAFLLGPAYDFLRGAAGRTAPADAEPAIAAITDAAWAAIAA